MGNLAGILRDFFGPTKQRLENFRGNFGAFFVREFVPRKKSFVPTSFCRHATLTKSDSKVTKNSPKSDFVSLVIFEPLWPGPHKSLLFVSLKFFGLQGP